MKRDKTWKVLAAPIGFALCFLVSAPAAGQQALMGPGAAYIAGGVSSIATAKLDDRLTASGYPRFGQRAMVLGIGAYRLLSNKVMLGGEVNGLIIGEKTRDEHVAGLGGGYATLGAGYSMALSPRVRVYPRVGFGAGGLALWIESDRDTVEFDDVLADPQPVSDRRPVLSRDGVVIDVGAGAELRPVRGRGALIGLRVGYVMARFGSDSNWQLHGRTARGGPTASLSGPYVRVVVGGAWSR